MVERRDPQVLLHRRIDPRAVAGQDRRGEGAVLARDPRLDVADSAMRSRKASRPSCGDRPPSVSTIGRPGVADRAEPVEPGDPAKVEAPGLAGAAGGDSRAWPISRAPGRSASSGVDGSSETRTRAGVRRGSSPWITTSSSSTRGRSLAERSRPTTRPSTVTVISRASTGAATTRRAQRRRRRSPKPSSSRRGGATRAAASPARTSATSAAVADRPSRPEPGAPGTGRAK